MEVKGVPKKQIPTQSIDPEATKIKTTYNHRAHVEYQPIKVASVHASHVE
jgi:hypothetical protein